jgi:hypothetical protein
MQMILIGFNRLVAALGLGANKSFDPGWLHTHSGAWPPIVGGLRDIYGVPGRYVFAALLIARSRWFQAMSVLIVPRACERPGSPSCRPHRYPRSIGGRVR